MSESNKKVSAQSLGSFEGAVRSSVHDYMYVVDGSGRLLDVNDRLLSELGLERGQVLGADAEAMWADDEKAIVRRTWEAVSGAKRSERSIRRFKGANGVVRIVDTREAPLTEGGESRGLIGIARDVSEEFAIEEKLWEEQRNREAVLEYSVRASLGLIKGYVYSLQKLSSLTTEQRERYGSVIIEEIESLGRNIDNLLLTRGDVDAGNEELCDLNKIVLEVQSQVTPEARRREIEIDLRVQDDEVLLFTRKEAVLRILVNIAEFCVLRITHSGKLVLEVLANDEYVDVILREIGQSAAAVVGENLLDDPETPVGEGGEGAVGSRLSLYVARLLCEAIGGGISARVNESGQQEIIVMVPRQNGYSVPETVALGSANGQ